MPIFGLVIWGNKLSDWVAAMLTGAVVYLALTLLRGAFQRRFENLEKQRAPREAGVVYTLLKHLHGIFILGVAVFAGTRFLTLWPGVARGLGIALMAIGLYQAGLWAVALVDLWIARRVKANGEEDAGRRTTLNALGMIARIIIWTLIILIGLDNLPNVNITSLIASLGIGGIAVGLAMQNILSDLFSSLTIALDKPFVIGDSIQVGEFTGTVENIGLKSTRVRALSGEQLVFSNSDLLSSRIRNYKRMEQRLVVFTLQVDYDTPPEKLERIPDILREVIEPRDNILFDRAHFKGFTELGLQFEVVYHMTTADFGEYVKQQHIINLEIDRRFRAEEIRFARLLTPAAPRT